MLIIVSINTKGVKEMGKKAAKLVLGLILLFVTVFAFNPTSADAASSQFITKANTTQKVVALTFDDGADGANINSILNTLDDYDVKATFFLTGTGLNDHPADIKKIADQGHQLGNHSYSHPDFTKLTAAQMKSELDRTEALAKQVTGKSTKPIFRAPYGYTNSAVLKAAGEAGYTHTIQWNIDTVDWKGTPKNEMTDKVVSNIVPGSIVLMHTGEGAAGTPVALPDIIQELEALDYEFVTMAELLSLHNEPPAEIIYVVKPGDTLSSIAQKYNTTVTKLRELNDLSSSSILSVGQILFIKAHPFTDITNHWAEDEIAKLTQAGIIKGRTSTTFVPGGKVTRAEFATLVTRAYGLQRFASGEEPFADVKEGSWYEPYVDAASSTGIINGYDTGSSLVFRPNQDITREEMAAMMVRAEERQSGSELSKASLTFSDKEKIGSWAEEEVAKAVGADLIMGYPDGSFKPKGSATRAESAAVFYRALDY